MDDTDCEFKDRTGLDMTKREAALVKRRLAKFFTSVEEICGTPASWGALGMDVNYGDDVRKAFDRIRKSMGSVFAMTDFHAFGLILREMPDHWTTRYRGAIAYFLAPFAAYYFEDPKTPAFQLAQTIRDRCGIPQFGG